MVLTEGFCFGEWGLIEKKERYASAYALEKTDLFILDKHAFNLSFSKCLNKAENERKAFILNRVAPFREIPESKFRSIYKSIVVKVSIKIKITKIYN
jgi:hypothetical protein